MPNTFYARYARFIMLALVCILPAWGYGIIRALNDGNNDVRQWLPRGFTETRQYEWFLQHFGSEEMAVVSWPGCTVDDERLDRLAQGLAPWTEENVAEGSAAKTQPQLFRRVITGRQALAELTAPPLNLSEKEALARLQGMLLGPDQRTSGLVVLIGEAGEADRHAALDAIFRTAEREAGISASELRMGGPTVDSVELDNESERSRYLLAAGSVVLSLLLAWRCLRHFRLVVIVFAAALLCAGTSVALVHYTGGTINLVLVTMPTMIFVLAISSAIHLANYYRDAVGEMGSVGAAERAVAAGWLPCTLTALTTAVGLGSLGVSEVVPVKMYGIYSALGVLCSLPVLFLFLPAALQWWPLRGEMKSHNLSTTTVEGSGWTGRLAAVIARYHGLTTGFCLALMLVLGAGLWKLETSVKLLNMFSPNARIISDYAWLEQHLGPLVPVEVVVRFDRDNSLTMLQRLELVTNVQQQLDEIDEVGGTMSAATFAPTLPQGAGLRQIVARRMIEKNMIRHRELFEDSRYLSDSEDGELWRISARVEALNSLDYGEFLALIHDRVQPLLEASSQKSGGIEATYTGVVPLVYKAQRELLNDLTKSLLTAFLLIALVMICMLGSVRAGLLSMLPNIFPPVLIFGAMGWSGRLCDIGSMMTASVALGIAVDDTIHFLSWFRRGIQQGLDRPAAVRMAYERCAGAMIQTTVVCGLGLLVFAFSVFVPTSNFAYLMCILLATALVGDLLFLPAILTGPLGRFFEGRSTSAARWRLARRKRNWQRALTPSLVVSTAESNS